MNEDNSIDSTMRKEISTILGKILYAKGQQRFQVIKRNILSSVNDDIDSVIARCVDIEFDDYKICKQWHITNAQNNTVELGNFSYSYFQNGEDIYIVMCECKLKDHKTNMLSTFVFRRLLNEWKIQSIYFGAYSFDSKKLL